MISKATLNALSDTYRKNSAQDNIIRELVVRTFAPHLNQLGIGLELGCSDGYMTQMLAQHLYELDVVEGAEEFIAKLRQRAVKNVRIYHALFEEFTPPRTYDFIIASYILTHLECPQEILTKIAGWLKPDGKLFVVVPNVRVLSRQLALHMGLLSNLKQLSDNDRNHGHRRSYDRISLNKELADSGFVTNSEGGIMLKPLADFQMDSLMEIGILGDEQIEGLYNLGFQYPDLCSALYSICTFKL